MSRGSLKENESVPLHLGRLNGNIESWDEEGLTIAMNEADLPVGLIDSFSSDRNRLVLNIGPEYGNNKSLNIAFEANSESGPSVVVRFTRELVEEGLRQTEDGLELRI